MTCHELEVVVADVARGQNHPAAVSHLRECAHCRALLDQEQEMVAALQGVALADESAAAPAFIEARLTEAFRSRYARRSRLIRLWPVWAAGAAAAALGLALLWPRPLPHPAAPATAALQRLPAPESPRAEVALPGQVAPSNSGRRQRPPRQAAVRPAQREVATEFMPLAYGDRLTTVESGQVIRIRLPRSALMSFGLPYNEEKSRERINADVLLDQDGLARAIRFIR